MLKKLTLAAAVVLIIALTLPAFSLSLSDVPADHWAYSAIEELVEVGIVEGYPDGEYKGQRTMNRYEMAIMVNRALDNIAAEQEELAEGLKMGQAEDTAAIVQSLLEKNLGEGLTYNQASEVADLVEALTVEFEEELAALGAELDLISTDLAELESEVAALDVPKDNLEFSLDIATYFEAASYEKDDEQELLLAMAFWAEEDVLDLDIFDIYELESYMYYTFFGEYFEENRMFPVVNLAQFDDDELPSEKRFWQELDFVIDAELGEAAFKLEMDTLKNVFTEEKSAFGFQQSDKNEFELDQALLSLDYKEIHLSLGDFEDYSIGRYFLDEEDLQGVELKTNQLDTDLTFLAAGFGANNPDEIYFIRGEKELDYGLLTTEFSYAESFSDIGMVLYVERFEAGNIYLKNYSIALDDYYFNDNLKLGGQYVYNEHQESDHLINLYVDYMLSEDLSINSKYETVGDDFFAFNNNLENDFGYELYEIGADFDLNPNTSLKGSYTLIKADSIWDQIYENYQTAYSGFEIELAADDTDIYEIVLENNNDQYTNKAVVEFINNNDFAKNLDQRTITLQTDYEWSERTTLGAKLVNKYIVWESRYTDSNDDLEDLDFDFKYNYLEAYMDKALRDNLSWNITGRYITGDAELDDNVAGIDLDTRSSMIKTGLTISF